MTTKPLPLLFTLMLVFSGCSAVLPINPEWETRREILESLNNWQVRGKVNVRQWDPDDSRSVNLTWEQQASDYTIGISGTLGVGMTTISGNPGEVTLQKAGERALHAITPEDLVRQQLGYELPVSQSIYWLKGLPAPNDEPILIFDELNQLSSFHQSGWQIDYVDYRPYGTVVLPYRIQIENEDFRLTFYRLRWNIN